MSSIVKKHNEFTIIVNGEEFKVSQSQIFDKGAISPYWTTTINGTPMANRNEWQKRYSKPNKSEIKRYIENYM